MLCITKEKDTAATGQDMQSVIGRVRGVIDTRNSIQPLWLSLIIFVIPELKFVFWQQKL